MSQDQDNGEGTHSLDPTVPLGMSEARTEFSSAAFTPVERPGDVIGPFRLVRLLGEGGMGQVWEAEQARPLQRKVALKLIKWGMDTREFLARFASERQALALMSHPHIARVYDAGATNQGRPYLVMEYVPGEPLSSYCDRQKLSLRQRLELFQGVCEGVQHAHQKGVIHRDLKPTNVLVTEEGGKALPKIIDFGLAKATEQRRTEQTVYTQLGQVLGTPEYMSPEQVDPENEDIDTRTDVYSLGVMLYELLTGTLPFASADLRRGGLAKLQQVIREVEPARPSSRATETGVETARSRGVEPRSLCRQLQGDLDWIVMKAMEKEPGRRYGSPAELSADVGRHLRHEPVLAGPPSRVYRTGKFVRRHRLGVTAAGVVLVALIGGVVGTSVGLARAQDAEAEAKQEAATTEEVSEFLVGLFEVSDPSEARGNSITAREILDRGAERVERQLADQPLVQARMMVAIGKVYRGLALFPEARELLAKALRLQEANLPPDDLAIGLTLEELFTVEMLHMEFEQAWEAAGRCLEIYRKAMSPADPRLAKFLAEFGTSRIQGSHLLDAERYLTEALAIQENLLPPEHHDLAGTFHGLALLHRDRGERKRAEAMHRREVAILEKTVGPEHPDLADAYGYLASIIFAQGRPDEAEPYADRGLAMHLRTRGPDAIWKRDGWFAPLKEALGKWDEAERLLQDEVRRWEETYGEDSGRAGWLHRRLGEHYMRRHDLLRARSAFERALKHATDPYAVIRGRSNLAVLSLNAGDLGRTRDEARIALRTAEAVGGDRTQAIPYLWEMATAFAKRGLWPDAEPCFQLALRYIEDAASPDHPEKIVEPPYLRACYHALKGNRGEALRMLREAVELGFDDGEQLTEDTDLGSLRDLPEFDAIVKEVAARAAQRAARAESENAP